MPLTFRFEVDHPHGNGDIPMEGIPSVRKENVRIIQYTSKNRVQKQLQRRD